MRIDKKGERKMINGIVVSKGGWNRKAMAALSYFGILCFVPLLLNKDDEFVAFHAKQGLILWIWAMLAVLVLYLPGIGRLLFQVSAFALPALSLIVLVAVILNRAWKLPFIHDMANKI